MRQHQSNPKIQERYRGLLRSDCSFNGTIRIMPEALKIPERTRKPTVFSVWNDLFHPAVPYSFQLKAFNMFYFYPQHHFIVCTKRPQIMSNFIRDEQVIGSGALNSNVTLMASASTQAEADLIYPQLLKIGGFALAASLEPLLEPIDIRPYIRPFDPECDAAARRLSWVVVGCETGRHRRPVAVEAIERIAHDCVNFDVPVFVKAAEYDGKVHKMPFIKGVCGGMTFYDEFPE